MKRQLRYYATEFRAQSYNYPSDAFFSAYEWVKENEGTESPTIVGMSFDYDFDEGSALLTIFHEQDCS